MDKKLHDLTYGEFLAMHAQLKTDEEKQIFAHMYFNGPTDYADVLQELGHKSILLEKSFKHPKIIGGRKVA